MNNGLTNLLPSARRALLKREYRFRFGVIAAMLMNLSLVAAAALLFPTYVFLLGSERAKQAHLASVKTSYFSVDERTLSARLTTLSDNAATLIDLAKKPSVSAIMRSALALPRPGITLSSFVYTPASGPNQGKLLVSGTAATRDALRGYQLTLQGAPFVSAADLPVSAYAKDTNIAFSITITLTP